jgi:hypothetical protein
MDDDGNDDGFSCLGNSDTSCTEETAGATATLISWPVNELSTTFGEGGTVGVMGVAVGVAGIVGDAVEETTCR